MNGKNVFWEALLLSIFLFASGIFLGYLIELNRTGKIITAYQQSELNLLDIQIQQNAFSMQNFECKESIKETINFADRTYQEALLLEKYSNSAKLSEGIIFQHKKYDLLRTILWMNSIKIKNYCKDSLRTIVYFYFYDVREISNRDQELEATQRIFSKYLEELKNKHQSEILLIPIAGNLEINSINLLKSQYGINTLPTVLVDEKLKIEKSGDLRLIDEYLEKNA